jgi:hypothetical protein
MSRKTRTVKLEHWRHEQDTAAMTENYALRTALKALKHNPDAILHAYNISKHGGFKKVSNQITKKYLKLFR